MAKIHKSSAIFLDSQKPVIIDRPNGGISLRESVLSQLDAQTRSQSAALKSMMIQEADSLIGTAQAKADRLLDEARQEAFMLRREAYTDARNQAEQELEKERERLQAEARAILAESEEAFHTQMDEALDQTVPQVLDLSLAIAEKILGLELDRNDEAIRSLVQQAMNRVKSGARTTVRISERYSRRLEALISGGGDDASEQMDLQPDETLSDGECLLEGAFGTVDAGVQGQLKTLRAAWEVRT